MEPINDWHCKINNIISSTSIGWLTSKLDINRTYGHVMVTFLSMDIDDDTGPKQLRITSNGKIKNFVSFALKFFQVTYWPAMSSHQVYILQKYDSRPLVLHTLPRDPPSQTTGDLNNATLVIPRLISVVEIIKREYIKLLGDTHSQRFVGLHQYNQLGTLEDLGYGETAEDDSIEDRAKLIELAMQGKKWVVASRLTISYWHLLYSIKLKQTPFLRITLSLEKIPELSQSTTYVLCLVSYCPLYWSIEDISLRPHEICPSQPKRGLRSEKRRLD